MVLSSPIAESSVTIAGVTAVVDCGWARAPRFDSATDMDRLRLVRVSKASADQRAGRAGMCLGSYSSYLGLEGSGLGVVLCK